MTGKMNKKDLEVLSFIQARGGEVHASDLKQIEWLNSSSQTSYRLDKMDELGVLDATDGIVAGEYQERQAQITETGIKVVEKYGDTSMSPEELESEIEKLREENKKLRRKQREHEALFEEIDRIMDSLGINMSMDKIRAEVDMED